MKSAYPMVPDLCFPEAPACGEALQIYPKVKPIETWRLKAEAFCSISDSSVRSRNFGYLFCG
jgi:hypothetical protein